jgi:hypothetical protein
MSVIMLIFVTIISVINFRFSKGGSNEWEIKLDGGNTLLQYS